MKHTPKKNYNKPGLKKVSNFKILSIFALVLFVYMAFGMGDDSKKLTIEPAEVYYKATSPSGAKGGISLPASCDSGVWNNNSGYHLVAPFTDPGNCNVAYNCEAGSLNPALGIITDHAEGVRFNNGSRWFNNRWYNTCYVNSAGVDLFVGTRAQFEKDSFNANKPGSVGRGGF